MEELSEKEKTIKIGKKKILLKYSIGEEVGYISRILNGQVENCIGIVIDIQYFMLDSAIRYLVCLPDQTIPCTEIELIKLDSQTEEIKAGFQKHIKKDEDK